MEQRGRHRDGTSFQISINVSPITGDVLLTIKRVSEVVQQMQAAKNAHLIAGIVQYSDDAIIGKSLDGVIKSWNPAAQRMYGYSSQEVIGRSTNF